MTKLQECDGLLKMVDLMKLAARPKRPQLAAADHSENWYELSGRAEGPVKGMRF
jgi:hypothetical protein